MRYERERERARELMSARRRETSLASSDAISVRLSFGC